MKAIQLVSGVCLVMSSLGGINVLLEANTQEPFTTIMALAFSAAICWQSLHIITSKQKVKK